MNISYDDPFIPADKPNAPIFDLLKKIKELNGNILKK